ncbi:Uncharacterised protein [Legionella donaldsonii]|uniref:Uncharacterized protein n=1 Tax=Legionella donaldsonii TaxID=45060 RepID=A0A378JDB3_9GAMM|nr:hypothetical protein [Legionella donaldsonii]STX44867.1 Uncharacterised protein [Legionella donaldsonii]
MRLYYRADTRSPKTIFQDGFQSKNNFLNLYGDSWWQHGVRSANDRYSTSPSTAATDADMNNVVCLAKKLESTPLFPVCDQYHVDYDSEIYIYVMVLPDAELPQDFNTPQPIDVFDMEALQVQQLGKIMSDFSVNPAMAGYVLSGHEAFAKNVPAQNIICAVKCKRSDFALTAGLPVFTKAADDAASYAVCQERYFEIGHEVFVNSHYSQDEQHKHAALDELRRVKAKGLQPTTRVPDALDQCGIGYDKRQIHTSTYFWQELTSLNLGVAFFSILESIYYAAIQLTKAMMRQSEQKPLEIVEDLPDSMQATPRKKTLSFYGRYFTTVGVVTGQVEPMTAFAITHF